MPSRIASVGMIVGNPYFDRALEHIRGSRWTGAAAAMLPRVVPEGGANLATIFVPRGV